MHVASEKAGWYGFWETKACGEHVRPRQTQMVRCWTGSGKSSGSLVRPRTGTGGRALYQQLRHAFWPTPAQSAKTARNGAAENLEGVRAAVAAEDVLDAAHKASVAACRAHSVRAPGP